MSNPLNANELKVLKGKEVWLIPLTNAVSRTTPLIEQITSDIIEKCGNKMFHLKRTGAYSFDDYSNSHNYGYLPFKTKQDALDYLEKEDIKRIKAKIENSRTRSEVLYIGKKIWHIDEPYQVFEIVCKRDGRFYALNPHPAFVKAKLISENSLGKIFFETKEECLEARILRAKRELDLEIEYKEREG